MRLHLPNIQLDNLIKKVSTEELKGYTLLGNIKIGY